MTTPDLRVGTHLLPPAEAGLIRAIVRLSSYDPFFNWIHVDTQPYDAVIVDGTAAGSHDAGGPALARAVLTIVRSDDDTAPDTLTRPIKAEKLQAWLKEVSARLAGPQQFAGDLQNSEARLRTRFKLRRWPPSALVRNDPGLIRMSTLLSRRSLLLTELAELSQQSLDSCHRFIQSLLPVGLLELQAATPLASLSPASISSAVQQKPPAGTSRVSFGTGLIRGIRRHLGL